MFILWTVKFDLMQITQSGCKENNIYTLVSHPPLAIANYICYLYSYLYKYGYAL